MKPFLFESIIITYTHHQITNKSSLLLLKLSSLLYTNLLICIPSIYIQKKHKKIKLIQKYKGSIWWLVGWRIREVMQ